MLDQTQLRKDAIISYVLLPSQQPTHPKKLWVGKIITVYGHCCEIIAICVESLCCGYEGLTEFVYPTQIKRVDVARVGTYPLTPPCPDKSLDLVEIEVKAAPTLKMASAP